MFVIAFILFYSTANLYLYYRFTRVFSVAKIPLACVWFFFAVSIMVFRNDSTFLPNDFTDILYLIGTYWVASVYYAFFITLFCDIVSKIKPFDISSKKIALLIGLFVLTIVVYGGINSRDINVKNYSITIGKKAKTENMRIVFLSDLHLGKVYDEKSVQDVVEKINQLKPQLVIIAGDIIDSDFNSVTRKDSLRAIKNIKSLYGIYAVMGNHEYIGGQEQKAIDYFKQNGINVLIEKGVKLPNDVLLFGKDDYTKNKSLDAIFSFAKRNDNLPLIFITHQPRYIEEVANMNVDLLFAGHTHLGQIYPNNYIVQNMYSLAYGYKKINSLQGIVTSGVGTWGPPVRVGTSAEIVCIDINFKK